MNDSSKRDEWDRHNRDEARERAAQQEAAGATHSPVLAPPYVEQAGPPSARRAEPALPVLVEEYERATSGERLAWLAVRDALGRVDDSGAWNAWRDAVERTQQAARTLVNRKTGD